MFTGYALGIAWKTGLSPQAAGTLFMAPLIVSTQPITLEDLARNDAQRMAVVHGADNVQLAQITDRDNVIWLIQIQVASDQPILEQWGVPLQFWADWLSTQAQHIGLPKGITYTVWIEAQTLNIQLESLPNSRADDSPD